VVDLSATGGVLTRSIDKCMVWIW